LAQASNSVWGDAGGLATGLLFIMPLGTLKKFFVDKGFGFITPDEHGQNDIFAPGRNLVGSEESKCREGLRVTYECETEARTNKPKATTWSILEGALAAALPNPNGMATAGASLSLAAAGYGAIPSLVDLQRYSPYGLAGQTVQALPGYSAIPGALGMVQLQGALPGLTAAIPGGVALPPGWEQALDPASGKVYYANRSTGETSWTPPPMPLVMPLPAPAPISVLPTMPAAAPFAAVAPAAPVAAGPLAPGPVAAAPGVVADALAGAAMATIGAPVAAPALPAGWEQTADPASGKTYYFNRTTGASSWDVPSS